MLEQNNIAKCIDLRRELHQHPELSNEEVTTAQRVIDFMVTLMPDEIITNLAGTGLAVCFGEASKGSSVLFRCELDALPIPETIHLSYGSCHKGTSHKCGHDGHMAILAGVGQYFSQNRPTNGRVILLFQPAEETGEGARNILQEAAFSALKPDFVFALHNVPGYPFGEVLIKEQTFSCASQGATISFLGKPAHAAQPETGISPVLAVNQLVNALHNLPESLYDGSKLTFATVVGVNVGDKAFGTAPMKGEVYATLRSDLDCSMKGLVSYIEEVTQQLAKSHQLTYQIGYEDVFAATVNAPKAVSIVKAALPENIVKELTSPFRWSEDFGLFTQQYCGAMFGLGAGEETPSLHNENYDFPDDLIEKGSQYFIKIALHILNDD
ncbi:MAG: amidohydrolase [Colwellia sp.]